MRRLTPEDFWARVDIRGVDECWPWKLAARDRKGYGGVSWQGRMTRAHRLAYILTTGESLTIETLICHRCDYPPCCNPRHLFKGTAAENNLDRDVKGRHIAFYGADHPCVKLTELDVIEIRVAYSEGLNVSEIAKRYNVALGSIYQVLSGHIWGHLMPSSVRMRRSGPRGPRSVIERSENCIS